MHKDYQMSHRTFLARVGLTATGMVMGSSGVLSQKAGGRGQKAEGKG